MGLWQAGGRINPTEVLLCICVAISEKIVRNAVQEDFDRIIKSLSSKPHARAVVVFIDEDDCRKLLRASLRHHKAGHFLWVGSDNWGAKIYPVKGQETAAEGAITILPQKDSLKGFDDYFLQLRPNTNIRNVWFSEYWRQRFNCSFTKSKDRKKCSNKRYKKNHEQEGLVPFVVDAVYAMAFALHKLIDDYCGAETWASGKLCKILEPAPPGDLLLKYIHNISFQSKYSFHMHSMKYH
ncbi:Metabotropic glutamate receptor 6 [Nymphon striatum]|nr:Metabotropic glutamate receptor 6 [Nymphon striatum]